MHPFIPHGTCTIHTHTHTHTRTHTHTHIEQCTVNACIHKHACSVLTASYVHTGQTSKYMYSRCTVHAHQYTLEQTCACKDTCTYAHMILYHVAQLTRTPHPTSSYGHPTLHSSHTERARHQTTIILNTI